MDVTNWMAVGCTEKYVKIIAPPQRALNKSEALEFAAWIVVNAECILDNECEHTFDDYLKAVREC